MIQRILAMIIKEVGQMRRDRLTVGMMFGIPIIQLMLFGFAINGDPRNLPMALEVNDSSAITRSIGAALSNSSYFRITHIVDRKGEGDELVRRGDVQFVITIPYGFTRDLVRGDRPQILVTADATDPSATGGALSAIGESVNRAVMHDAIGAIANRSVPSGPVEVILHRNYNPEGITSHNIVPGLLAIILSMTMVMMTSMAVTRETERGTMENLLAMPLRPIEVMIGKITPYLVVGFAQTTVVLLFASLLFQVPMTGPLSLTFGSTLLFIALSLALGFTISTLAQTQLQAMQISFFYFLPSILLSGFMFPFRGMPNWAQYLGEIVPATHFMRVIRGVMLKGWGFADASHELLVMLTMLVLFSLIAVFRYRDTVA